MFSKILSVSTSFAFFALLSSTSSAADIQCNKAGLQKYEEIICEYSILNSEYEGIYQQQEKLMQSGRLSQDAIVLWRKKRDSCTSVTCMDTVFAEWKTITASTAKPDAIQKQEAQPTFPLDTSKEQNSSASLSDSFTRPNSGNEQRQGVESLRDQPAVMPVEETTSAISPNPTTESSTPIKQTDSYAGISVLISIVFVLSYFFRRKGSDKSEKTDAKKIKPAPERYPRGWKCCASCEYWSGNRDVEFGNKVTVDKANMKGKCLVVPNHPRPSNASSRCQKWRKWGVLTE